MHGEIKRLTEAGLLTRRSVGRSALVRANLENRAVEPLTQLLLLTFGPLQVVAEEFAQLRGAREALIFGSWAARYRQSPGPPPNDLDVLVIGAPERAAVYDGAGRAQQRLGLPVNPVIRSEVAWQSASDSLVQQIQAGPSVVVLMPDD